MKNQLNIEIGDLCCAIKTEKSAFFENLESKYGAFISHQKPKLTICVKTGHDRAVKNYSEVRSFSRNGLFAVRWGSVEGEIDLEAGKAWVKGATDFYSFDSFLRILYSLAIVKLNGFLVHAAGIIRKGKGYVFVGPAESGKTTIARLSSNCKILSDEVIIIKRTDNDFQLAGTPFYGELETVQNMKAKAEKMFLLRRGKNGFYRRKLNSSEAAAKLLKNVLFFTPELQLTKRLLDLCSSFCRETRCEEIDFLPNNSFWRWIDDKDG